MVEQTASLTGNSDDIEVRRVAVELAVKAGWGTVHVLKQAKKIEDYLSKGEVSE